MPRHPLILGVAAAMLVSTHGAAQAEASPPFHSATAISARTAALDPASGALYLPAARLLPAVAGARPALVPGQLPPAGAGTIGSPGVWVRPYPAIQGPAPTPRLWSFVTGPSSVPLAAGREAPA